MCLYSLDIYLYLIQEDDELMENKKFKSKKWSLCHGECQVRRL